MLRARVLSLDVRMCGETEKKMFAKQQKVMFEFETYFPDGAARWRCNLQCTV